jgi:hypothetical protein
LAGVSDEYLKKSTDIEIKRSLGNSNIYINSTRDIYYRIHGVSENTSPRIVRHSDESLITVHETEIVLDKYLKAKSKYSVIHFCENQYGVVSDLNMSANSEWEVQDNESRDILIGIWLKSAPKLTEKLNLACVVAELLGGSVAIKERVVSDVGISCGESFIELKGLRVSRPNRLL